MNVLQMQFLGISEIKKGRLEREEASWKKAKRGRNEFEVCDSETHNVQFNMNCQMIS